MDGFSFVTPITGLNRPNTRKKDDDDDEKHYRCHFISVNQYGP
jgi:hypothetical protein